MSAKSAAAASHATTPEDVLSALKASLPAPRYKEAAALADAFFKRTPDDDLQARPAETWAAIISGLLDFARQRKPGTPSIRLFNPEEGDGWNSSHTVVQIVNDDMPFLVDSVGMAIAQNGVQLHTMIHPVIKVHRDPGGMVLAWGKGDQESLMHLEIDRQAEPRELKRIEDSILAALQDVRACVRDWAEMKGKLQGIIDGLDERPMPISDENRAETKAFLEWVADDHFTFLGYREYEVAREDGEEVLKALPETGLGILRDGRVTTRPRSLSSLAAHELQQSGSVDTLILTKTNARASVHRAGYMDYIGILRFNEKGQPVAEQRFLGLYTSGAYTRRPWDIPRVRQRFDYVMNRSGFSSDGHSGKALKHILETLPRDELFQSSEEELFKTAMGILGLQERSRTKLFVRRDRYGRFFSCIAYIPRDRFNTDLRHRIEAMLKRALRGERLDTNVQISDSPLAQLHLIIRPKPGDVVDFDQEELETKLAQIVRNWHDELRDILVNRHGEDRGLKLAQRFGRALPPGYIEEVTPSVAAVDVENAAEIVGADDLRLSLTRSRRGGGQTLRFKLFRFGQAIPLSDALPMMEDMGLRVLSEHPYAMHVGDERIWIQDFEVDLPELGDVDVDAVRGHFEQAFERIWRGQAESDGFNRLIIGAGMDWRQVAMLRGYCKYLLQTEIPFSQTYMEETLARYPLAARLLVELFEARFDPTREDGVPGGANERKSATKHLRACGHCDDKAIKVIEKLVATRGEPRENQIEATVKALYSLLDDVSSLDEDRILRSFMGVIRATLRTSYFQERDGRPQEAISFKFDSAKVPDLPKPRPYREIFVYGPRVEGVHLRFGPVARGGLRWSDRREDFRTEVLGLVKAQMVKNTVIVPVGAKGGFFVKRPPIGGDRDAILAEGIACYRLFINGLLDITDNLVEGKVVHPQNVVRHDADDPYLVVAADKGTATFSDIANSVSAEHGFWMDDAFASGGSNGYDHKGMGITARGAWESVKRHFRFLGRDSQSEDFTCAGVGDMSGDVFGNGMLLSRHIRLVAAFDHRHIFLDPNPNAASSFVERERMFALPRSSWDDYDREKISKGGGIYPRSAKSIPISPEVAKSLGIDAEVEHLSPNELLSAILRAPVDLLWNGGIGTYVKASDESHSDVGDRANNLIRVNGCELRCRVVGEGGNLGLTQCGRIEAAMNGVLLNTDFIDNSAGVDTSDREVNIKILLNDAVQREELDEEARNQLLASMTDEVGALVLMDNYRQNQAISVMERMSLTRLGSKQHFIRTLESQGLLDRQLEFLPSDAEISERKARGLGLTRPELSILLSYAKIVIYDQLLDSDVPEDPYLSNELLRYFPEPLRERFAEHAQRHRLKREIIATAVTNSIVNRMGSTFMLRMQEDTGETPAAVAKAFTIAREIIDARGLWAAIDQLDLEVPEGTQIDALLLIWGLLRGLTRWLLGRPGLRLDIAEAVDRYLPGVQELRGNLGSILGSDDRDAWAEDRARWLDMGFSQELAEQLSSLPFLMSALDIIEVSQSHGRSVTEVAKVFFGLGEELHIHWLLQRIEELPVEGRWHAHARGVLRDELQLQQSALVSQLLADGGKSKAEKLVADWVAKDDNALRFTLNMFADMRNQRAMDFPTVSVAVRRLAQLAAAAKG
ncbi:MAG: NAD-glutamate dehydrogenase [Lysobacteraceae bacterium]|nr:NAD-glutamate dehydrogenase [Xanthomonadaceae bacterium]HRY01085.1 NAD-glutamate dehydrogenase [Xanthomonadaceae bacterium]